MKGCRTCGRVWARSAAPNRCPECGLAPVPIDSREIAVLISRRQGRMREARSPAGDLFGAAARARAAERVDGALASQSEHDAEMEFIVRRFGRDRDRAV